MIDLLRPQPPITVHLGDCLELMRELPDESVDAVVTDAPYGLSKEPNIVEVLSKWLAGEDYEHRGSGFMGKSWDSFVPGPAVWREVFRVLKPGGHLVCFAGTRTADLMGIALRMAGFTIRDTIHWAFWSGFPKSLDVSKGIDKMRHDREQLLQVTRWIRDTRDAAGLTNADLDRPFGFAGMAGHWTTPASQPAVPTLDQWPKVLGVLGVAPDEVPPEIRRLAVELNSAKGEWGNPRPDRVTDQCDESVVFSRGYRVQEPGSPATDDARHWSGFGTAIKPAIEPAILARKPLRESSIARQVLATGTGALNIDATRFSPGDPMWPGPQERDDTERPGNQFRGHLYGDGAEGTCGGHPGGRFPANLVYCPKASRSEREIGCEGLPAVDGIRNFHPTVKPVRLMRWLVRLVTPPGGVVLDPFMGSGTCGAAASLESFGYIGAELSPEYHAIAAARVAHARRHPLSWAHTAPGSTAKADNEMELLEKAGQWRLFK